MEKMNISALNHHVGSTERVFVAHVNDLNGWLLFFPHRKYSFSYFNNFLFVDFYLHSESVHESVISLGKDLYNEYSKSYTYNKILSLFLIKKASIYF
jgi:hypothetical protein